MFFFFVFLVENIYFMMKVDFIEFVILYNIVDISREFNSLQYGLKILYPSLFSNELIYTKLRRRRRMAVEKYK